MKRITALVLALLALCLAFAAAAEAYESKPFGIRVQTDDAAALYATDEMLGSGKETFGCVIFYYMDKDAMAQGLETIETQEEYDALYASVTQPVALLYVMADTLAEDFDGESAKDAISESFPECGVTQQNHNGLSYFLVDMSAAPSELDEALLPAYAAAAQRFTALFADAEFFAPSLETLSFVTKNIEGETVTEEIFAGKELTVINVWATWCNPCLNEMPELAAWAQELPEGVQLLFLCQDLSSEDDSTTLATVRKIADKTGIDPKNVLFWLEGELPELDAKLTAFPTTFFVDGSGQLLNDMIVGANPAAYKQTVEALLGK